MPRGSHRPPSTPASGPLLGRGPPSNVPPPTRKRKITHACVSCRALRTKCSGHPCTTCLQKNIECVVDRESDQRKKIPLRREMQELEEDQALFIRLLRTLRHRHPDVEALLDYIAVQKPSLAEIKVYMDRHLSRQLEQTPELLEAYNELTQAQLPATTSASRALDIARLCDIPPFSGRADVWTTVTNDDQFVSHLLSLFFTWHAPFFNYINRELFLRDLQSGSTDSTFCSPLLVNAVLADACSYSDYPEAFAVPGDVTTKGEHFWRQAKELLDAEEGELSLTTVQAIALLYSSTSIMGKDRLGWLYVVRASKAIPLLRSSHRKGALTPGVTSEMLDRLESGFFGASLFSCLAMQKPPEMEVPKCDRLPEHQHEDTWFPYPRLLDPVPNLHTNCVTNQRRGLGEISWEICQGLFGDEGRPPVADMEQTINKSYERLQRWAKDLPDCLRPNKDSLPEVLSLHMQYHTIIMTVFAFLKTPDPADPPRMLSRATARHRCISAAHAVSRLVATLKAHWGADRHVYSDHHFICVALFMLIDDLAQKPSHDAFLILATAALPLSSRSLILKGMFRQVQVMTIQANASLSPQITRVFKRFERRLWRPEDRRHYSSAYPNFAAALRQ
ncbi:hypothetical protein ASPVEDRAFT_41521 [Aspergillus versicolor CBS 583.65]|uniref:Zn(2)-C6 fungal-type domain-containing protein n=1 Tax=Aspergillus versicolor CBS 583.65 TaxID=1036611 RepID=A0A1L9PKP0_ASPVE|nr:uncharacterized protein ASPVEDRAFT_41521 [Aspergillus versicolor CBS 583.65]OJJ01995.1 hypothetical protein ASPVEDRAFT_41521 [Aspergillus versicolor CBS 583.65]